MTTEWKAWSIAQALPTCSAKILLLLFLCMQAMVPSERAKSVTANVETQCQGGNHDQDSSYSFIRTDRLQNTHSASRTVLVINETYEHS